MGGENKSLLYGPITMFFIYFDLKSYANCVIQNLKQTFWSCDIEGLFFRFMRIVNWKEMDNIIFVQVLSSQIGKMSLGNQLKWCQALLPRGNGRASVYK